MIEAPLYDGEGKIAERADSEDEPSPNGDTDLLEQHDGEDYSDSKNATIVGDSSNIPDLAKRGDTEETVGQCAKRLREFTSIDLFYFFHFLVLSLLTRRILRTEVADNTTHQRAIQTVCLEN